MFCIRAKGRLIKCSVPCEQTLDSYILDILTKEKIYYDPQMYPSPIECIIHELPEQYKTISSKLYQVIIDSFIDRYEEDVFNSSISQDNTINFDLKYDDSVTTLSGAIDMAIKEK